MARLSLGEYRQEKSVSLFSKKLFGGSINMVDLIPLIVVAAIGLLIVALIWIRDNLGFYLLFSLCFTEGLVEMSGYPAILPRCAEAFIILLLLAKSIVFTARAGHRFRTFGLRIMLILLALSVFSALYNVVSLIAFGLYFRLVFIHYLFFTAVLNLDFSEKKVNNLVKFWILIQIPVSFIKFAIVGVSESWVATVSAEEGSVSAIFPMFVGSILLAHYLFKRNPIYLLLIIGYVLFAVIGAKSSIIFFMPVILLAVLGFYIITSSKIHLQVRPLPDKGLSRFYPVVVIILAVICSYGAARLSPAKNPEGEIGGSFDIDYIADRIMEYTARYGTAKRGRVSRYHGFRDTVTLMNSSGAHNYFGFGPGDVTESRFLPIGEDPLWFKYGIGYGGRSSLVRYWVETGILSVLLYWAFQMILARKVYSLYQRFKDTEYAILALGFLGVVLVASFDYFVYSDVMVREPFLAAPYYYIAALLLRRDLNTN